MNSKEEIRNIDSYPCNKFILFHTEWQKLILITLTAVTNKIIITDILHVEQKFSKIIATKSKQLQKKIKRKNLILIHEYWRKTIRTEIRRAQKKINK